MYKKQNLIARFALHLRNAVGILAVAAFIDQVVIPAFATIDNTATVTGTPASGSLPTPAPSSSQSVPVTSAAASLTTDKTVSVAPTVANGANAAVTDGGDTITYQYLVTNNGNVTMTAVAPSDPAGPTFNGIASAGALSGFTLVSTTGTGTPGLGNTATLAPGKTATFTAVYTLDQLDALRAAGITNGVSNTANAVGTRPGNIAYSGPDDTTPALTTIPAGPELTVAKTFAFTTGTSPADAGDVITYTYTIANTGNVTINNVTASDTHEGSAVPAASFSDGALLTEGSPLPAGQTSTDTAATPGVWGVLRPGATITFTYVHTVTQTEVDAG